MNIDGHVGACGFLPISPLTKKMHPVRLIRVDDRTGEVIRSKSGLCVACNPGERYSPQHSEASSELMWSRGEQIHVK